MHWEQKECVSYDKKCAFGPTFEPIVMLIYVIQPIVPKCEIMWEEQLVDPPIDYLT